MTNPIPDIEVKRETKKISTRNPNIRDVACLIGGFETDENYLTPVFYETLAAAEAEVGTRARTITSTSATLRMDAIMDFFINFLLFSFKTICFASYIIHATMLYCQELFLTSFNKNIPFW